PEDPEKAVLFDYTWRDLTIITGYRNRVGRTIVAVELDPRAWTCDGMRDPEWDVHWFLLDDPPALLGRSFELVDAGDYDGDGKSEILFWHSGETRMATRSSTTSFANAPTTGGTITSRFVQPFPPSGDSFFACTTRCTT